MATDFGRHLASMLEPKSSQNPSKVVLKRNFKKIHEKVKLQGRNSIASNLKNIAKTMEDCSKSYYSNIHNKVEKKHPQNLYFGEVLGTKIDPRAIKITS